MRKESAVGKNQASILIVDDNPKNLQIVGNMLQDEGIEAEFATNGDSALEWINNKDFDLVLLDVMMPEMNGFQVCEHIKNNSKYRSIPIIFLTAQTDTDSIMQGFDAGAVDYITKPFNKKELLARVTTHLRLKKAYDDIENYLDEIALKTKLLTYSIQYAQRIQNAILPPPELLARLFNDYFIFFQPKDIVSGDFYWIKEYENIVLVAVADCTGHGVPGAFMSMLGYTGLNQAVNEYGLIKPSEVLSHVHQYLKYMLQKTTLNRPVFDGMDITLCKLDRDNNTLECSGANNPIYMVRNGEFFKIKGDRVTIGDVMVENLQLTNQEIQMKSGDIIYMVTDGFSDQFGGDAGKKFSSRRFIDLLKSNSSKPCTMQLSILEETFEEWMEGQEQVDDVTILGILI